MAAETKRRGRGLNLARKQALKGYLYISPWIIGFCAFYLVPNVMSLKYSLTRWSLTNTPKWVGLQNYINLMHDPTFLQVAKNTFLIVIFGSCFFQLGLALLVALGLAGNPRGGFTFRSIFYLPGLVMPVAQGLILRYIYSKSADGLLNQFIGLFGLQPLQWIEDPRIAVWAVILASPLSIGFPMVVFLAGIKGINPEYLEAAKIDGAGTLLAFRKVTLPLLTPVLVYQFLVSMIGGFQLFDFVVTLANIASNGFSYTMGRFNCLGTFVYYMYQKAFQFWEFGYGSAIAWVVFAITLILGGTIFFVFRRQSFYGEST